MIRSGNVVLEAFVRRVPVICLDLGGPGVIVDNVWSSGGTAVKRSGMVTGLSAALAPVHRIASAGMAAPAPGTG